MYILEKQSFLYIFKFVYMPIIIDKVLENWLNVDTWMECNQLDIASTAAAIVVRYCTDSCSYCC